MENNSAENIEYEDSIKALGERLGALNTWAVAAYAPMVEDICTRKNVSRKELENLLDWLVSSCISDDMIELFKRVCRHFYHQYPQLIADYVLFYKELYEEDVE